MVDVDVQRSLWSFTEGATVREVQRFVTSAHGLISLCGVEGWPGEQRDLKRQELRHVLDAAICSQDGSVFYYQGLHDIASVLLFVMGEMGAYQTLSHLSRCQLRDCTRYAARVSALSGKCCKCETLCKLLAGPH